MRLPQVRINPTSRVAATLHVIYMVLLPLLVLSLVRSGFTDAAIAVIILSKWRMFAVKPRYWLANIRANSVDMIVGFSVVIFMSQTSESTTTLLWAGLYSLWLIIIKPRSSSLMVSVQALLAQGLGLVAVFNNFSDWNPVYLIILAWLICFCAAKHLLLAFEDDMNRPLSHLWAIFAAELALIFGHWHIVYIESIPMIALVLSVVGYSLALGYYLEKTRGLSKGFRQQLIISSIIVICMVIIFTEWQTETF
jgi:hypothetical protein